MDYPENLIPTEIPDGWLELRIHGVSGTPPEYLLRDAPVRVSGNEMSGFYRIGGVENLEAYSWGGLTSGKKRHALWLLLLPFSLVNVAGWMTPCPLTDLGKRLHAWLTRLLALAATALTTLFATVLIMDLGAWRPPATASGPEWLSQFATWWYELGANVRMAMATLLVAMFVAALGLISKSTRSRYEATDGSIPIQEDPILIASLDRPEMWGTRTVVDFFGPMHTGLALGICAVIASWVEAGSWELPGLIGGALVLYAVGLVSLLGIHPDAISNRSLTRFLPLLGLGAVLWTFSDLLKADLVTSEEPLDAPIAGFTWIVPVVVVLLLALLLLGQPWKRAGRRGHAYALAAIALSALTATGSGAVLVAERLFERERAVTEAFDWLALLFTAALSVVMTLALMKWDPLGRRADDAFERSAARWKRLHDTVRMGRQIVTVWGALLIGGFITILVLGNVMNEGNNENLPWAVVPPLPGQPDSPEIYTYLAWIVFALPLLTLAFFLIRHWYLEAIVALAVVGYVIWRLGESFGPDSEPTIDVSIVSVAAALGLLLPAVGMLFLIWRARSDRNLRQSIGIIWDLTNFWPRWYHPWAAPPYSEISIPDLRNRIAHLTDNEAKKVLISAHSQGAIASIPAILQPPTFMQGSYAFLTYGCLLGTVYRDLFPQYLSDSTVLDVYNRTGGRFRNLYRETDPLGDAISNVESEDPVSSIVDGIEKVLTHSDYQYSPEYQSALTVITAP